MPDSLKLSKADAGRLGARARWRGERRVVNLADLRPEQRRVVLALVEAARTANQADPAAAA